MKVALTAGVFAILLSWAGTRAYLAYAQAKGILDYPNERSSHRVPTPRGGGVAIVLAVLGTIAALAAADVMPGRHAMALGGGGLLVATVGYLDDRHRVPAATRFIAHIVAAVWVVWWLGPGTFPATDRYVHLGAVGDLLAVLFTVWMINLTNFMDGIDGLAAAEAGTVAFGGVLAMLSLTRVPVELVSVATVLGASCAGFLAWNWPPARIFMGDVGSGFLGFMVSALALHAALVSTDLFWGFVILSAVFVSDATWTLLRRIHRRERFYQAHRSHAYQRAARRTSHRTVTATTAAINVLWLLPLALLAVRGVVSTPVALTVAYVPVLIAVIALGAGVPDDDPPPPPSIAAAGSSATRNG